MIKRYGKLGGGRQTSELPYGKALSQTLALHLIPKLIPHESAVVFVFAVLVFKSRSLAHVRQVS